MRRIVALNNTIYTVAPEDAIPLAARTWAIMSAHLVDEITGQAPQGTILLQASQAGLQPRIAADGLVGLTGIPQNIFPHLATTGYNFVVTMQAEGYVGLGMPVSFALLAGFPNSFVPTDLGTILLHCQPVVVRGRVVAVNGHTTVALPHIPVAVTGVRDTLPDPFAGSVPPDPPNLIALRPSLYAPRTTPTGGGVPGSVRRRDVVAVPGVDKALLIWAASGDSTVRLSDQVQLASGDVLMIDALNPDLVEYITIAAISGASTADQPASITLTYPLAYEHKPNAVVRKVTPQVAGADNAFARDAISGDRCVFLASMSNLSTMSATNTQNVVEIIGGSPAEYHSLSLFSTRSDALGYFQLPPVSRVAQVDIQADRGGGVPATVTRTITLDYSEDENRVDILFP